MAHKVLSRHSPLTRRPARSRGQQVRRKVTAGKQPPGEHTAPGQAAACTLTPEQMKHLDYINDAVGRHVTHAFAVKGWSLTVTGVVFAFAAAHRDPWIAAIALVPPIAFAWLDLYYLHLARLYEEMYRGVIHADPAVYPLDMDATRYRDPHAHPRCSYGEIMRLGSWWVLHGMVVAVGLALLIASIVK